MNINININKIRFKAHDGNESVCKARELVRPKQATNRDSLWNFLCESFL